MYLYEELSGEIYDAALEVYNTLGHGFLEKVYENALIVELGYRNIKVEEQKKLEVKYKEKSVGVYYADLIVDDKIIIELKSTRYIAHENYTQLLNYLTATEIRLGLLINFSQEKMFFKRIIK